MKISEVNVAVLSHLQPLSKATEASECTTWSPSRDLVAVPVRHVLWDYLVGRWSGEAGPYWMVELRTGSVYRGTLGYIRQAIRVCSWTASNEVNHEHP